MGDPYLILTNPQHKHVYTDEQLASYDHIPILFLFAANKAKVS